MPISSCGAWGLESTLPREPSSGPSLILAHLTLTSLHSGKCPEKDPELKIWAKETDFISSQPGLQTCQTANGDEESDLGADCFCFAFDSYRHNPGTPPRGCLKANRGAIAAQKFCFTCLNLAASYGKGF